jgi:glyoxylase-like metal-dependent hydrolase (beta-lactamase superfamily II)
MNRLVSRLIVSVAVVTTLSAPRSAVAQFTKPYEVVELTEDIFAIIWDDILSFPVEGNNLIIINEDDVVVVDSKRTPSLAMTVIEEIRKRTDKPVRYLINTHWHADHLYANYVFQDEYPGVEIIGHPATAAGLDSILVPWLAETKELAATGPGLLASGRDADGELLTDEARQELESSLERAQTQLMPLFEQIRLTAPTLEITSGLTLQRGSREIQVLHLGRGNTPGDLVVYLPEEKIVATGDLVVQPYPFLGLDDYPVEWSTTLGRIAELDVEVLVPGHGNVQHDLDYLHLVEELFASLGEQVQAGIDRGWDRETITENVDLDAPMRAIIPDREGFARRWAPGAVAFAYRELMERAGR